MATTQTLVRTLPDIFYEDPEPVEDGMQQAKPLIRVAYLLYEYFADRPDVYIGGGGFVMYNEEDGNERIAPDCYIAFDVDAARIEEMANFWVWRVGKVPDFVMEMASRSTAANDLGHKRDLYESLEIAEYWRLDPTGGELYGQPLTGERLVDGAYEPYEAQIRADGSVRSDSELLGLRFYWDADDGFDILDPETDTAIEGVVVERAARLVAEARADTADVRADTAEARADTAEAHAGEEREARLAEQAARQAAEAEARALREELERLRRQQADQ